MRLPFISRSKHETEVVRAQEVVGAAAMESFSRFVTESPMFPQGGSHGAYKTDFPWAFFTPQSPRRKPTHLLDASTLRRLAEGIDPLRSAIEQIKREVREQPILVVPKDAKDRKAGTATTLARVTEAEGFFRRTGGNGGAGERRTTFESKIVEDLLVIGAWAIYREWNLGGEFSQYAIDAATIIPRVDGFGFDADKPFEQWIDGRKVRAFDAEEMIYDGVNPRSWNPYFVSPIEWILSALTSYVKMDEWNRTWLTDGNAPGSDVYELGLGGAEKQTPDQVRGFIAMWDAMRGGNSKERQKVAFLPAGSKNLGVTSRKDQDFQEFETQLIRRVCSVFGVQPASIGYAGEQYKVSQEGSHDQTSRFGVGSVLLKRKELYDETLEAMGYDDLEVVDWNDEEEDSLQRAQRLTLATGKPWMTRNEARAEEGMDPVSGWDEEDTAPAPDPAEVDPDAPPAKRVDLDAAKVALEQWEAIALRRLGRGQSPAYLFRSEALPESVRDALYEALDADIVTTADAVRMAFAFALLTIAHSAEYPK